PRRRSWPSGKSGCGPSSRPRTAPAGRARGCRPGSGTAPDEQSVVLGRDPDVPLAAGQQALDPFPLVIAERVAAHRSVLLFGQPAHNRPHAPTDPSIEGTP